MVGVVVAVVENLGDATEEIPTTWRSFDLADPDGDGRWSGGITLSACTDRLQYLVQIYDAAGNVRVMSNKASGFESTCDETPNPNPTRD